MVLSLLVGAFDLVRFTRKLWVLVMSTSSQYNKNKQNRFVGLVVKASDSRLRLGDFSGSSHTSDVKFSTPVATLSGTWRYRVSSGTGWDWLARCQYTVTG